MTRASVLDAPPARSSVDPLVGHRCSTPSSLVDAPRPAVDPHRPVLDVHDLVRHVEAIVPGAVRRQLWTLFFDADDIALPLMVPLEGIPENPDPAALEHYGDALAAVATEFGALSVAFVVERIGPVTPQPSDRRWRAGLARLGDGRPFSVRPVVVCGDDGVAAVDPVDPVHADPSTDEVRQASSSPVRLADIVRLP